LKFPPKVIRNNKTKAEATIYGKKKVYGGAVADPQKGTFQFQVFAPGQSLVVIQAIARFIHQAPKPSVHKKIACIDGRITRVNRLRSGHT
jgi:hypothetical protein